MLPTSKGFMLKVYPSGRAVAYRKLSQRTGTPTVHEPNTEQQDMVLAVKAHGALAVMEYVREHGLPPSLDQCPKFAQTNGRPPVRRGKRGMPREAQLRVKEYAAILEARHGAKHLTFGTVTVPPITDSATKVLHENWNHFCKLFRQRYTRLLERRGLSRSLVYVTEIQPHRFDATGKPYLHLHYLHQGRHQYGSWLVSTREVREMVADLIAEVVGYRPSVLPVCRLEPVRASAVAYLGKYMSKGARECEQAIENGYEGWLPRQWWGSTRDLPQEFKKRTRVLDDPDGAIWQAAMNEDPNVWQWVAPVDVEVSVDEVWRVAFVGDLAHSFFNAIRGGELHESEMKIA